MIANYFPLTSCTPYVLCSSTYGNASFVFFYSKYCKITLESSVLIKG